MSNNRKDLEPKKEKNNDDDLKELLKKNPNNKINGEVYRNLRTFRAVKGLELLFPEGIPDDLKELGEEKIVHPKR